MEFEFEKKAMNGEPLPGGLDIVDSCLYIGLKSLYAMYRKNEISRIQATEDKKRLVANWTADKSKLQFLDRDCLALKERISSASKEYCNNPSIETADKLYAAFYNLPNDWRNKKG